jgi:hypothetical protein
MRKLISVKTLTLVVAVLVLTIATAFTFAVASDPVRSDASPVLVELFTSEGCSSCPPADALLGKLDEMQPIPGVDAIVLSEHVDYWDHDGWKDAYSSSFFTERQGEYVRRLGSVNGPYTPQLVVDGAAQLNGSDALAVGRAIESARSHAKIPVRISFVSMATPKSLRVHIVVDALPAEFKKRRADIFAAVALDHAQSHVLAGENKGRDIRHVAVAQTINKVGTVEKGKNFDRDVLVKINSTAEAANLRLIIFVQESDAGEVFGATQLSAPIKISLLVNLPNVVSGD